MSPELFIKTFICPYCNSSINQSDENESDYECKCGDSSYTCYNYNEYSFYLNLPQNYQVQIHVGSSLPLLSLVEYPPRNIVMNPKTAFHLELNFIPENLNWKDPSLLLEQLELLTTFS